MTIKLIIHEEDSKDKSYTLDNDNIGSKATFPYLLEDGELKIDYSNMKPELTIYKDSWEEETTNNERLITLKFSDQESFEEFINLLTRHNFLSQQVK